MALQVSTCLASMMCLSVSPILAESLHSRLWVAGQPHSLRNYLGVINHSFLSRLGRSSFLQHSPYSTLHWAWPFCSLTNRSLFLRHTTSCPELQIFWKTPVLSLSSMLLSSFSLFLDIACSEGLWAPQGGPRLYGISARARVAADSLAFPEAPGASAGACKELYRKAHFVQCKARASSIAELNGGHRNIENPAQREPVLLFFRCFIPTSCFEYNSMLGRKKKSRS